MQDLLDPEEQKIIVSIIIDLQTLRSAMEDFGLDNMLGQVGFGPVYEVCGFNVASSFGLWLHFLCHVEIHVSILRGGSIVVVVGRGGGSGPLPRPPLHIVQGTLPDSQIVVVKRLSENSQ